MALSTPCYYFLYNVLIFERHMENVLYLNQMVPQIHKCYVYFNKCALKFFKCFLMKLIFSICLRWTRSIDF